MALHLPTSVWSCHHMQAVWHFGVTHCELFLWSLGSFRCLTGVRKHYQPNSACRIWTLPFTDSLLAADFALSQPSSCSTKQPAWQTSIDWWVLGHVCTAALTGLKHCHTIQAEIWCAPFYWHTWATDPLWRIRYFHHYSERKSGIRHNMHATAANRQAHTCCTRLPIKTKSSKMLL